MILDCDNTIWGGIIGEDGLQGIALGQDFPGSAFRDLQSYIVYLQSRGLMVALLSKNNEQDVWDVFDKHDGMVLKREHIAAWRINWEPKSANIVSIAEELNIGLDSIVFIDDNPFEINEVQASVQGVTAIALTDEPSRMVQQIRKLALFDVFEVTKEDSKRTEMMLSEKKRNTQAANLSREEFIASLGLVVSFGEAQKSQLGRVAQLINKTNQFNLTTVRRTLEEVTALAESDDWKVYTVNVQDKFGDYGLVGVAITEARGERWRIDTLLMSCRVLGRGVETTLLGKLGQEAREAGAAYLDAAFIPTAKNAPAADVLPRHRFTSIDDQKFEVAVDALPAIPEYVTVKHTSKGNSHNAE